MKRHIRKAFAICVAMVLLFAMAVPALGVSWYLSTYPYTPHTSTTVDVIYRGSPVLNSYCFSFTVSVGTAMIRVSAPSYTNETSSFGPYQYIQGIALPKASNKSLTIGQRVPVTCALYNITNPSTASTSANGDNLLD